MATDTLPAPTRSDTQAGDVDHLWCCVTYVAMCGVDLTGVPDASAPTKLCPLCALADDTGMPCPVPGCRP
ncbi:hypothetical protein AB0I89_23590 [Micromonospora sp. NPDC049801]|uniref:hypothetical protein n=1 Tax=unclassified Micromonospora TaxID=2617518 RepID=UPI0033C19BFB